MHHRREALTVTCGVSFVRRRKQLRAVGLQAAVAQSNACMLINRTAARADCGMEDEYRIWVLILRGVANKP